MVFTSLKFIIFMAIVFYAYYIIPLKSQWILLLIASYVFYASASPLYLIFLFFTTVVTYAGGILIENGYKDQEKYLQEKGPELNKDEKKSYKLGVKKKQQRKIALVIFLLLGMVVVFKYATFALNGFTAILGVFGIQTSSITLNIILPLGLSFYVFQSLGYCLDVYREMADAEHNFWKYALYVSYFPQLLQGPIGDYNRLAPQLFKKHEFSYREAKFGLQRVAWGFFKKLVIANQISLVIDGTWEGYADYSGFFVWVIILCMYSIQLYADFSGYMDIAIGCSQMLGIELDENFDTPYFSKSISEFWRRWHITLGAWFKNYVFYSILRTSWCDGIRKKFKKQHPYLSNTLPTVIALIIVWTLIGLWHGADLSYVMYGWYHGFFIVISTILAPIYSNFDKRLPGKNNSKIYACFQIVRTFVIVTFGYVIFRPASLDLTKGILNQMFSSVGIKNALIFCWTNKRAGLMVAIASAILFFVDICHTKKINIIRQHIENEKTWKRWLIYLFLVYIIFAFGVYGENSANQFAYFKF